MRVETLDLKDSGRVYLNCYLSEWAVLAGHRPKRGAVLICPGGAYSLIANREGEPIALAFAAKGFQAFVVGYSIGMYAGFPNAIGDAGLAMKTIRENAEAWDIDPDKIAVCGFSAGGHVASCLASMWNLPEIQAASGGSGEEIRPNAVILGYPCVIADVKGEYAMYRLMAGENPLESLEQAASSHLYVGPHTPPAFVFNMYEDQIVPVEHGLAFCNAMAKHNRPFELHTFQDGSHSCALADASTSLGEVAYEDPSVAQWFPLCISWLWRRFGAPVAKNGTDFSMPGAGRAQLGQTILPDTLFAGKTTSYSQHKRFSLTTRIRDVLDHPSAKDVVRRFLPGVLEHPRIDEFSDYPVQFLIASSGKRLTDAQIQDFAKAMREIK